MIYEFFIYNIKVSMCLALLYISYRLVVHASTRHEFNKLILFTLIALSFIIPLIDIDYSSNGNIVLPQIINISNTTTAATNQSVLWSDVIAVLFLVGVFVSIVNYLISVITALRIIRSSKRHSIDDNYTLCIVDSTVQPFNWFKYIVLSASDYNQQRNEVLIHEKAHLQSHHTIELTLVRLVSAIQWYNPIMWLILRDVRAIHEYQADAVVINSGIDTTKYQLLLIDRTASGRCISCTNNFGQVKLKNRIIMMTRTTTTKWAYLRLLYIAPAIAIAMICFSNISCTSTEKATPPAEIEVVGMKGDPVIMLEGKEISQEEMGKIDPNTIEAVRVLKGDSAAIKYGHKDGVIEITLK